MCEGCRGSSVEQARRTLLRRVAEYDYAMVSVQAEYDPLTERTHPAFVYSVGLWCMHYVPDVIVVAPHAQAVDLVRRYAEEVVAGAVFEPGTRYDDFVEGRPVVFEPVAARHYPTWLASGFFLHPDGEFSVLQMLWPDENDRWPWDDAACPVLTADGAPHSRPSR